MEELFKEVSDLFIDLFEEHLKIHSKNSFYQDMDNDKINDKVSSINKKLIEIKGKCDDNSKFRLSFLEQSAELLFQGRLSKESKVENSNDMEKQFNIRIPKIPEFIDKNFITSIFSTISNFDSFNIESFLDSLVKRYLSGSMGDDYPGFYIIFYMLLKEVDFDVLDNIFCDKIKEDSSKFIIEQTDVFFKILFNDKKEKLLNNIKEKHWREKSQYEVKNDLLRRCLFLGYAETQFCRLPNLDLVLLQASFLSEENGENNAATDVLISFFNKVKESEIKLNIEGIKDCYQEFLSGKKQVFKNIDFQGFNINTENSNKLLKECVFFLSRKNYGSKQALMDFITLLGDMQKIHYPFVDKKEKGSELEKVRRDNNCKSITQLKKIDVGFISLKVNVPSFLGQVFFDKNENITLEDFSEILGQGEFNVQPVECKLFCSTDLYYETGHNKGTQIKYRERYKNYLKTKYLYKERNFYVHKEYDILKDLMRVKNFDSLVAAIYDYYSIMLRNYKESKLKTYYLKFLSTFYEDLLLYIKRICNSSEYKKLFDKIPEKFDDLIKMEDKKFDILHKETLQKFKNEDYKKMYEGCTVNKIKFFASFAFDIIDNTDNFVSAEYRYTGKKLDFIDLNYSNIVTYVLWVAEKFSNLAK